MYSGFIPWKRHHIHILREVVVLNEAFYLGSGLASIIIELTGNPRRRLSIFPKAKRNKLHA